MGLETATYINGLVTTNPTSSDPKSQGDDHLRLVKSTVKATFPNITGAVTPTQTDLNVLTGAATGPVSLSINGTVGATTPAAVSATSLSYSTTLTGGTGIVNLGAGQFYKDTSGNVGIGTASPGYDLDVNKTSAIVTSRVNTTQNGYADIVLGAWNLDRARIRSEGASPGAGSGTGSGALSFWTARNPTMTEAMRIDGSGNVTVSSAALLGYGTGSGGTVTQGAVSGKSTAVTLNKPTGAITMNNAALTANTSVFFDVNNSLVAATDNVLLTLSNFSALNYTIKCFVSAGKYTVILKNETAGSLSEAVVINFAVIKGATS